MAAPALRIPVELDTESLKRQMDKGASHVKDGLTAISTAFKQLNSSAAVGGAAVGAFGVGLTRIVTGLGAVTVAMKVLGSVIEGTREQMAEMVEIGERARDLNIAPEFLQAMRQAAKGSEELTKGLEGALAAFDKFTRAQLSENVALGAPDALKQKWTDVDTALFGALEALNAFNAGAGEAATRMVRDADTQEKRIRAILQVISDLLREGQRVEALNLAEKAFGREFAENVRKGKQEVDDIIKSLDRLAEGRRTGIFSDETVRQVEELDKRLQAAQTTISTNLRPSFEDLARLSLSIKGIWVEIVEAIARASENIPRAFNEAQREAARQESLIGQTGTGAVFANPQIIAQRQRMRAARGLGPGAGFVTMAVPETGEFGGLSPTVGLPLPRARPPFITEDKPKETAAETRDRLQAALDSIEKRTQGLKAETAAIDLNTASREKAKITAELTAVAMQVNGKVTDENKKKIEELATAYGNAVEQMERARSPLASFARESANLSKQFDQFATSSLNSFTNELADVVTGAKSAEEAFKKLAQSILNDLARIAIRATITGPIAKSLTGAFAGLGGAGIPALMAGGPVTGGMPYIVGERGPELFVPNSGGIIVPNQVATGMGGSAMSITVQVDLTGANGDDAVRRIATEATARGVQQGLSRYDSALPGRLRDMRVRGI